jgi:hypothetical protein
LSEAGDDRTRKYQYDTLNRRSHVAVNDRKQSSRYDGENLRYETEEDGNIIRFLF